MTSRVSRVTVIRPDGTDECRIDDGWADDTGQMAAVRESELPDWAAPGIEVVAAYSDGTVETAFVAHSVHRKVRFSDADGEWTAFLGRP